MCYIRGMARSTRSQKGLGRIYRRGAAWWLDYTEGGKRHRHPLCNPDGTRCATREEAERERRRLRAPALTRNALVVARAAQAEAERLSGRLGAEVRALAPALPQAWAEYVRHPRRRRCGESTLGAYRGEWERLRRWLSARRPPVARLDQVTQELAEEYAADLAASGVAATTCNRHVVFLRSFFRLMVPGSDPFGGVPLQRARTVSRRALTREELASLISAASGEVRTLILLGAATGMRLGDCCTLQWREVDADALCVRKRTRKTGAVAAVPLPPQVLDALGVRGDGPVLPGMAEAYATKQGKERIWYNLKSVFRAAGIATHEAERSPGRARSVVLTGFHSLRHTWVSAMSAGGAPPALIQLAVGHSSPAMTEHYTHATAEGLRSVADAVGRMLVPQDPERAGLERDIMALVRRADIDTLRKARDILSAEQPAEDRSEDVP